MEWGRIGRDFSLISRKLRKAHWELTGSSIWGLNASKDASIFAYQYAPW